jgi:hypothetical protein
MLSCAKGDGRGSSLGCGPGGRLWSAISRTLMTLLGWPAWSQAGSRAANKSGGAVVIAIVRFVSQALILLRQAGRDAHRLADRRRRRGYPSARRRTEQLESLKPSMRPGRSLYAPKFRWHRARREAVPAHAAHRPLESSRRAAPRPWSSPPVHHVGRERWDARQLFS